VPAVPEIFSTYTDVAAAAGRPDLGYEQINKHDFYDLAKDSGTALVVATAETAIYANILLTIGVVHPPA